MPRTGLHASATVMSGHMLANALLSTILGLDGPVSAPCGLTQPLDPDYGSVPYDCAESQDMGYDNGDPFDITVVMIDGEPVEKDTANAFWVMREAASADGVEIHINSGFRTMEEQEYFYMCYTCCCCNSCNLAAQPGYSNHQSGHALDLNTSAAGVYDWLAAHGGEYGFSRTVPSEDWHWEWWGGGPGGGICDIAAAPTGTLDAAGCEGIRGWAQDPDAPEAALDVEVAFGAPTGDPAAVSVSIVADQERADLCEPLGTCNHGFTLDVPLSLQDGAPHDVHVYAIDSDGADNAELVASPQQLMCPPPPVPEGVRRATGAASLAGWGFSTFWQMMKVDAATLDELDEWTALANAPLLVRTEDAPEVWWVDSGWRRHVPSPEVAAAWGLDLSTAEIVTAEILDQWREGTPMRDRPVLVSVDGVTVYLIDDAQGDGSGGGADGGEGDDSGSGSGGDDTLDPDDGSDSGAALPGADDEGDAGCGCAGGPSGPRGGLMLLVVAAIGRRRARARSLRVSPPATGAQGNRSGGSATTGTSR